MYLTNVAWILIIRNIGTIFSRNTMLWISNTPRYSGEDYYSLKIRRGGREISVDAFLLGGCAFQRARIRKDTVDTPSAKTLGKQQPEGPRSFLHFKLAPLLFVKCRDSGSACISRVDKLSLERVKDTNFQSVVKTYFKIIANCRIVKV